MKMCYAVRKDGTGWRSATPDMVDPETETYQVEPPEPLPPVPLPEPTKAELLVQVLELKATIEALPE